MPVTLSSQSNIRTRLWPVVLPVAAIVIMSGLNGLAQRLNNSSIVPTLMSNRPSPTDKTLSQYAEAERLIIQGNQDKALKTLIALGEEPLTLDSMLFADQGLNSFSPAGMLLHLSKTMMAEARKAGKNGDFDGAERWLSIGRQIGDRLLQTPLPTTEAVTVAHHIDKMVSETEVAILPEGHPLRPNAEKRLTLLSARWHQEMLPALLKAREHRDDLWNNRTSEVAATRQMQEADKESARRLLAQYEAIRRGVYGDA
jgi:hypothetical protein